MSLTQRLGERAIYGWTRTNPCLMSNTQSDNLKVKESFQKADPIGKVALAFSSWFGAGLLPKAPGTLGTLGALPVAVFMKEIEVPYSALLLVFFIALAVWAADLSRILLGREDPPEVVIDEVAGFLLTVFLLPSSWLILFFAFLLFRVFDIAKPFPIRRLERIKGGMGIVLDDLLAGLYAALSIRLFMVVFQSAL